MTEEQQKELADIKERLAKVEALIPDERYAVLIQSLRDDMRTLLSLLDDQQKRHEEIVAEELANASFLQKVRSYDAFVQALNADVE